MQDDGASFALLQDIGDGLSSGRRDSTVATRKKSQILNLTQRDSLHDLLDTDSEDENEFEPKVKGNSKGDTELPPSDGFSHVNGIRQRIASAGPSGRQTVTKMRSPLSLEHQELSSDSESEISEKKPNIPGEYDPNQFQDLDVSNEIKDLFQYITKYIPQNLNLDFKFKPFIPDYIPAVGDIDAFLKVKPPEFGVDNEKCTIDQAHLGLTVLDEPSVTQSDPALLHLKLRASSVNVSHTANMVVKKVDNVEKNTKTIDKWIKDITDLHRTKTSPVVKYSELMPDIDDLMQAWPEKMETLLKVHGFPNHQSCPKLSQYIDIVCCLFNIPIYKNKIQSLHLLFSLYAAIKNSQLYKASENVLEMQENQPEKKSATDQLLLE
ncbi:hypothetical protein MML48_7g00013373 [Holotrichia oblita]|uniref:Uncharacterized protein n=1 Tax=Holotrichia oblita TaxID=644536 RepID=A0ACB9SUI6_HOLOL|nr:hypothetical protein MML48_7g00013373 [Holotrichia oblita]